MRGPQRWIVGAALIGLGCRPAPSPTSAAEATDVVIDVPAEAADASGSDSADAKPKGVKVPDAVTRLHAVLFERPAPGGMGSLVMVITSHSAGFESEVVYPAVVFAGGKVATWTEKGEDKGDLFAAKLTKLELETVVDLAPKVDGAGQAQTSFQPKDSVIGFSRQTPNGVRTVFFTDDELPKELDTIVGLVKGRLEAENAPK